MTRIAIIGFGEAGPIFAGAFAQAGWVVTAHDLRAEQVAAAPAGVAFASDHRTAIEGADLVLSTVTASDAERAAQDCAPALRPGQHFIDLNSVAPVTKSAIAEIVSGVGATFTEAVAMDTVPQKGAAVPILACGPGAAEVVPMLAEAGLMIDDLGSELGRAAGTKLTRSIVIKGLEAMFAEMVQIGGTLGTTDAVLASLQATFPGLDWAEVAGYHLSRMTAHAERRAAEMEACAAMLRDAGLDGDLTAAIAAKHRAVARDHAPYDGTAVADFIAAARR
ncbi:MAG: DUF1932 domain-containing protein [Pseudomonadota bacterium]